MKKAELQVADDLMQALTGTEMWLELENTDPQIQKYNRDLHEALNAVLPFVSSEVIEKIELAANMYAVAYSELGILYGISVSKIMSTAIAKPQTVTGHMLKRVEALA